MGLHKDDLTSFEVYNIELFTGEIVKAVWDGRWFIVSGDDLDEGICTTYIFDEIESVEHIKDDMVNHPPHYTSHPSGVEYISITEHMNFCLGNALKYIWRAGLKSDNAIEDLKKAEFYIKREIRRLEDA